MPPSTAVSSPRVSTGRIAKRIVGARLIEAFLASAVTLVAGCDTVVQPILTRRGDGGLFDSSAADSSAADSSAADSSAADSSAGDASLPTLWEPDTQLKWHIRLSGPIQQVESDVAVYEIDVDESPMTFAALRDRRVICYFSAGSVETWRDDAARIPLSVRGNSVPDYPSESYIDIRDSYVRSAMSDRLDRARDNGCDAIAPSGMAIYSEGDIGLTISETEQLDFDRWLIGEAHRRGLSFGLADAVALHAQLVDEVEFARASNCVDDADCAAFEPFRARGKAIFHVEWDHVPSAALCARIPGGLSTVFSTHELDQPTGTYCQ